MDYLKIFLHFCLFVVVVQSFFHKDDTRNRDIVDYSRISDIGNYTCDEIVRWIGTEKHYSNDKKNILFGLLVNQNCQQQPFLLLEHTSFGMKDGKRTFFLNPPTANGVSPKQCSEQDEFAVAFLSNFSINNNFSHFLHALVRLFCALLDSKIYVWSNVEQRFIKTRNYAIWLDENFRLTPDKEVWLKSFDGTLRSLSKSPSSGDCVASRQLIYGSGCVRLLPPEKWFGYPGCRASDILPAFGAFMRNTYKAGNAEDLKFIDDLDPNSKSTGLRVAFAVRDVGAKTGSRQVSNLEQVQNLLRKTQHIKSSMENVTFEHLDVPSTIRYMSGVHIFVSVHGAGMTNMFFMSPGSAVVEIIPFPLCTCKSPDYFYGVGGYYHGSAVAQKIKHYHYCVPAKEVKWHKVPDDLRNGGRCSWKHLHAVESVFVDPSRFVSLMRNVERDLIVAGTIVLTKPIIVVSPHANG